MIREEFANRLREYMNNGGIVLAQGQIGMRDFNDNYLEVKGPQYLQDVLGVYINGGMYLYSQVAPTKHGVRIEDILM